MRAKTILRKSDSLVKLLFCLLCVGCLCFLMYISPVKRRHINKLTFVQYTGILNFSFFYSKELRSLRVVRVELDSGRRLVGLRYPEPLITEVSELIRQQKLNALAVCILLYSSMNQSYFLHPPEFTITCFLLTCSYTNMFQTS